LSSAPTADKHAWANDAYLSPPTPFNLLYRLLCEPGVVLGPRALLGPHPSRSQVRLMHNLHTYVSRTRDALTTIGGPDYKNLIVTVPTVGYQAAPPPDPKG